MDDPTVTVTPAEETAAATTGGGPPPVVPTPAPKRVRGRDRKPRGRPRKVPVLERGSASAGDRAGVQAWVDAPAGADAKSVPATPAPKRPHLSKVTKETLAAELDSKDRELASLRAQLAPGEDREQLEKVLIGVLRTAGEIAARMTKVPDAALLDGEAETMAASLAPVLAPLMAQHGDKAPWLLALVTCGAILARPTFAVLEAQAVRKRLASVLPVGPDGPLDRVSGDTSVGLG